MLCNTLVETPLACKPDERQALSMSREDVKPSATVDTANQIGGHDEAQTIPSSFNRKRTAGTKRMEKEESEHERRPSWFSLMRSMLPKPATASSNILTVDHPGSTVLDDCTPSHMRRLVRALKYELRKASICCRVSRSGQLRTKRPCTRTPVLYRMVEI